MAVQRMSVPLSSHSGCSPPTRSPWPGWRSTRAELRRVGMELEPLKSLRAQPEARTVAARCSCRRYKHHDEARSQKQGPVPMGGRHGSALGARPGPNCGNRSGARQTDGLGRGHTLTQISLANPVALCSTSTFTGNLASTQARARIHSTGNLRAGHHGMMTVR